MGSSHRYSRRSNSQSDITSTLRVVQETGRFRPRTRSRTALMLRTTTQDLVSDPAESSPPEAPPAPPVPSAPSTSAIPVPQTVHKREDDCVGNIASGFFDCNICFEVAIDPVLTPCGHLFCWPCIYQWLNIGGFHSRRCPICMGNVVLDNVIPIFGRGPEHPRPRERFPYRIMNIPPRPSAVTVPGEVERRPPRSRLPVHISGGHGGAGAGINNNMGARSRVRPSSTFRSHVMEFMGLANPPPHLQGPYPGFNTHPPALDPIGFHLGGFPATSVPASYLSSLAHIHPPLVARIMQNGQREANIFVETVRREASLLAQRMQSGLQDGVAEMMNNMIGNNNLQTHLRNNIVNPGGVNEGPGLGQDQSTLLAAQLPDPGSLASSSTSPAGTSNPPRTQDGNTVPPPSVGKPTLDLPPEKRRRF
ncbi:hypothetical protein H6P81_004329 [Aristolochia fimbriata]|uniref:E3 ubiquitin-protein ligase RMA n=1 Tax=Aristolochia fimbriata TaxID=158543 RepID=A0AAV7FHI9_ARIFI|nr:hypothetical protein H6P81_004329 [Aristolochia fimbriata]